VTLHCPACDFTTPRDPLAFACPRCGTPFEVRLDLDAIARPSAFEGRGVWRYRALLPVAPAVTLGEGDTGLHRCERLGAALGVRELYVKNEGENPTGSFKDRGMTVGIAMAAEVRAHTVACASTGNTAASMAAYAARAGLRALVLIPEGKVAAGKLSQAIAHAAVIAELTGDFDDAMRLVTELTATERGVYLLNSLNPFRLEGQKTLAYEVCETLGRAPEAVVLPIGNAGNVSAIWKGFREFLALGMIHGLPRMIGVQAERAAPIVKALREGGAPRVEHPETVATAIRIGAPVNAVKALAAIRDSNGDAGVVTDHEILAAQRDLAAMEGLFVEPASAAPIAYLRKHGITSNGPVVCVATGHGLKDPDAVSGMAVRHERVAPTIDAIRSLLAR
jgi:threonine synthase